MIIETMVMGLLFVVLGVRRNLTTVEMMIIPLDQN